MQPLQKQNLELVLAGALKMWTAVFFFRYKRRKQKEDWEVLDETPVHKLYHAHVFFKNQKHTIPCVFRTTPSKGEDLWPGGRKQKRHPGVYTMVLEAKFHCQMMLKKQKFSLSNVNEYKIPHFFIWKLLKNPIVGRPTLAGYNCTLTPASIFVGHFLKVFFSKFNSILANSTAVQQFYLSVSIFVPGILTYADVSFFSEFSLFSRNIFLQVQPAAV